MFKQGSLNVQLWDHYFFLYINDLSDNLTSNPQLFANYTSLSPLINDRRSSANKLNQNLNRINNWAFQKKMSFNPDPSKQAHELLCFLANFKNQLIPH